LPTGITMLATLMAADAVAAAGGAVTAIVVSDRTVVSADAQFRLTLTVSAPDGTQVGFAPITGSIGAFELVYQTESGPETLGDGRSRWRRTYRLQPRQTGVHVIPPLVIEATMADASTAEAATAPLAVIVTPALAAADDLTSLRTIAPIVAISAPPGPWWWIAGAAGALLLAVVAVRAALRRPRHTAAATAPVRLAHAVALAALEEIRRQGLIEGELSAEFHSRLSQILRSYVEWRFDARALTQTTEEFLAAATETEPFASEWGDLVVRLLQRCDLAKFARQISAPAAMQEALKSAEGFVNGSASNTVFAPQGNRWGAP
jgi:hypothetical protein